MRDRRKRNVETVETKSAELAKLEASLTEMQGNVETAQARREALEEELQKLLQAHKKELDALKEKRSEVEVETVEPGERQASMRPLQESAAKASAAKREKKTELDTWTARKARAQGEEAALREELRKNRDSVRPRNIVSRPAGTQPSRTRSNGRASRPHRFPFFPFFSQKSDLSSLRARETAVAAEFRALDAELRRQRDLVSPFPRFSLVPRETPRALGRPFAFRGSLAVIGGARAGRGAGNRGTAGTAGRPGRDRPAVRRGGEHGVRRAGRFGGGNGGGRAALR